MTDHTFFDKAPYQITKHDISHDELDIDSNHDWPEEDDIFYYDNRNSYYDEGICQE